MILHSTRLQLKPASVGRAAWPACALLAVTVLCGCTAEIGPSRPGDQISGGPNGGLQGLGGTTSTSTSGSCDGNVVVSQRRLVRLTLSQVKTSMQALLGVELGNQIATKFELGDVSTRTFPPLAAPEEGTFVTETVWGKSENMGRTAAKFVRDNYVVVTGCAELATDDACALSFLSSFAEKAFRRPLTQDDQQSLSQVYTESKSFGAPIPEALEQAVWAVLSSPHFLYRTELGGLGAVSTAGSLPLSPDEMASQLSFFLTDGPPDQALRAAVKAGELLTRKGILTQVDRLLSDPAVQDNVQQAVFSYFGISNLDSVVIDQQKVPEFTVGLKNAMYHETQEFLRSTLWGGRVNDLLTSRKTLVNPDLAKLYGVAFPANAANTADTFAQVDLPAERAGLLTQAGFLSSRARPDKDSVVGRGLLLSSTMLCASNPAAPPDGLKDQIAAVTTMLADKTEREQSEFRQTTAPCSACHVNFDAYGLVLQNFDLIGRYRGADDLGRPIDPSTTLPQAIGGAHVSGVVELADTITRSGAFATCMARNLMKYALADGNVDRDSCAVRAVDEALAGGDGSFRSMLREIVASQTLTLRGDSK
jgi:Protein of unknown function (DUF1592)/Protein of unknown function (DUF1588)/Protein of unknown function (DUF1595)/Protein of unknown function (DUF1585)